MILATANHPPRAGRPPVNRYGADVVALQERPDRVGVGPRWGRHRPKRGRSTAVVWRKRRVRVEARGSVHLGDDPAPRYLVWVRVRWRGSGRVLTVASVHLPAFKDRNGPQYRAQLDRIRGWLVAHPDAVVLGDWNAEPDSSWLAPLRDAGARYAAAPTHGRKRLDHAWSIRTPLRVVRTVSTRSDHDALIVDAG